jgi:hypothetical protein
VRAINAPSAEAASAGETRFSFIAYGDNREESSGGDQDIHARVVDSMLDRIQKSRGTESPIRFVVQSGDGVYSGAREDLWNDNVLPIVNRLTAAGIPYYMAAGNHDVTGATTHAANGRKNPLRNMLAAIANLIPPDGSPRRLATYPTYGVGYGNVFVLTFDSNLIGDETQYAWVKAQLEGLDRTRFPHVFIFCHQNVFSSGPHGGSKIEAATAELRTRYMPLFREHHVAAVISGHEHFFEHWMERYTDASGPHRMDLIVSGGGGASRYGFSALPETQAYIDAAPASQIQLDQMVRPGPQSSTPYHYVILHVDGDKIEMEVVAVGTAKPYLPYNDSARVVLK